MANFNSILAAQSINVSSASKEQQIEQTKFSESILKELQDQSKYLSELVKLDKEDLKDAKKVKKSGGGLLGGIGAGLLGGAGLLKDMFGGVLKGVGSALGGLGGFLFDGLKTILTNKFFGALALGGLAIFFKDELGDMLGGLGKKLSGLFQGLGKSADESITAAGWDLGFSFETLFKDTGAFLKDLGKWINENLITPIKDYVVENWPIWKQYIIDGFKAGGELLRKKIEDWIGVDVVEWWDEWGEIVRVGVVAAFGTVFGAKFFVGILARAFPGIALGGALANGLIEGFKEWSESRDFADSLIAGLGGVLSFLTFGLLGEAEVRAIGSKLYDLVIAPIVEVFDDFGDGVARIWLDLKKKLNEWFGVFDEDDLKAEENALKIKEYKKTQLDIESRKQKVAKEKADREKILKRDPKADVSVLDESISSQERTITHLENVQASRAAAIGNMQKEMANYEADKIENMKLSEFDPAAQELINRQKVLRAEQEKVSESQSAHKVGSRWWNDGEKEMERLKAEDNKIQIKLNAIETRKKQAAANIRNSGNVVNEDLAAPPNRVNTGYDPFGSSYYTPVNPPMRSESLEVNKMSSEVDDGRNAAFRPVSATTVVQDNRQTSIARNVAPRIGIKNEEPTINFFLRNTPQFGG